MQHATLPAIGKPLWKKGVALYPRLHQATIYAASREIGRAAVPELYIPTSTSLLSLYFCQVQVRNSLATTG
jgi:hypothetical protein